MLRTYIRPVQIRVGSGPAAENAAQVTPEIQRFRLRDGASSGIDILYVDGPSIGPIAFFGDAVCPQTENGIGGTHKRRDSNRNEGSRDFRKCSKSPLEGTCMSENVKKAKAPAKPRKASAKKADILTMPNGSHSSSAAEPVSKEEVARLAHRFWAERGCQHGHDIEDWFRAEQELRARAS
jgi:hypothetical protein